jgi:hypothetical protein
MSRVLSLAGFQVTLIGRFWVIPEAILCTNVLKAIAERPGRIYEGKPQDINLMSEAYAVLEKGAEISKKKIAAS